MRSSLNINDLCCTVCHCLLVVGRDIAFAEDNRKLKKQKSHYYFHYY